MSRGRLRGLLLVAVAGALVVGGPAPRPGPAPAVTLFRAPQAVDRYVADHPELAAIAAVPQFTWLGERDRPDEVRELVRAAAGRPLPLVLYGIPQRDLVGRYSAGGFGDTTAYGRWVGGVADALGDAPAVLVVEPDAVGQSLALAPRARHDRLLAIRRAVDVLRARAPRARVYLEASTWIGPATMAPLLWEANVGAADGVALNVAGYRTDAEVLRYGEALSARLAGRHYVVDSSRNGRGPGPDATAWCNVPGRGLGRRPGPAGAAWPRCDGYLWIKRPGVSDGTCHGGPPAGVFWPAAAADLVAHSS